MQRRSASESTCSKRNVKGQGTRARDEQVLYSNTLNKVYLVGWAKNAEKFTYTDQPVIALKGAKVGDFGGASTVYV